MNDIFKFPVPIEPDKDGMVGRECPQAGCEKYFKVKNGTGLTDNTVMYCPYCTHKDSPDNFFTKEQIEYANSLALHHVIGTIQGELKRFERHSFKGPFFSLSIKVKSIPFPIKYYVEKQLQEYIICNNCNCEYAIYGVFAICPDCGKYNVFQILAKNIDLIKRQINLEDSMYDKFGEANRTDIDNLMKDIRTKIIENACEDTVTVFETFFKTLYEINKYKATNPSIALLGNPFQSLDKAKDIFLQQFNIDILEGLKTKEIDDLYVLFNKRHILTHNLGIIDHKFLKNTGLGNGILNHKVKVSKQDTLSVLDIIEKIAITIKAALV